MDTDPGRSINKKFDLGGLSSLDHLTAITPDR